MTEENEARLIAMKNELEKIQGFLEIETSDDPRELVERLATINVYLARTGRILADATYIRDQEEKSAIDRILQEYGYDLFKAPPTTVRRLLQSSEPLCNYVVTMCDRLNRACVHQGDNIRTQVSFAKEELRLTNSPYGNPR